MRQRAVRVHDLLCVSIFGVLPLRTRHAAGCPKHREQIVFRREDNKPLSSRRNTICSRPSVGLCICSGSLPALQQRDNLIVVRMGEHIEHTRGDRLIGRHARYVSGKGFCVAA